MLQVENSNVLGTALVAVLVFALLGLAVFWFLRQRKGCHGCASCPYSHSCHGHCGTDSGQATLDVIVKRQVEQIKQGACAPDADPFATLVTGDSADTFLFSDIDYTDSTASTWSACRHYSRLHTALVQGGVERLCTDALFREQVMGLLRYWVRHDFVNPNWWHNQIGAPKIFADIALLLESADLPVLDEEVRAGLARIVSRGTLEWANGADKPFARIDTARLEGANLIWVASISIKYALWQRDEAQLRRAVDRIKDEICYAQQGIQRDGGFFQHGPLWYSGGYGRSYTIELAPFFALLEGTPYAFSKEKTALFLSHVLDGQRQMQHKGYFDFGAVGRELSRKGALALGMEGALSSLAGCKDMMRRAELEAFLQEAQAQSAPSDPKTVYYDSLCQLCHRQNGSYIGVRGLRAGLRGTEICNREGVLAYNMSYGTYTCLMRTGKEYYDIAPIWDYSAIPGTTARKESDRALLEKQGWDGALTATEEFTPCGYGAAEDHAGLLGMRSRHDGLSLTAAYFTFDGCLVAMGADIKDSTPEKGAVYTTVNQCYADREDLSHAGDGFCANGEFAYRSLDGATVFEARADVCRGAWSRNNLALSASPVEGRLFLLQIPKNDSGTYAYMVYPREKEPPQVAVLRNDSACQAIALEGRVLAVFHEDDTLVLPNGGAHRAKAGSCLTLSL